MSLWEIVQKFEAGNIAAALQCLQLNAVAYNQQSKADPNDPTVIEAKRASFGRMQSSAVRLSEIAVEHGFLNANAMLGSLAHLMSANPMPLPEVLMSTAVLACNAFVVQLQEPLFLKVPAERAWSYNNPLLFGARVPKSFQSATYDITEAGNCFAAGCFTACGYHVTRAMERPLIALAAGEQIDIANLSAGKMIDKIGDYIAAKLDAKPKPPDWKGATEEFWSEAMATFRNMKNAFRNSLSHQHPVYDEPRARTLMITGGLFMDHVAGRISEPSTT